MRVRCVPEDFRVSGREQVGSQWPPMRPDCFRSALPGSSFFSVTPPRGHVGQAEQPAENVYILRGRRPYRTSPRLPTPNIVHIYARDACRVPSRVDDAAWCIARIPPWLPFRMDPLIDSKHLMIVSCLARSTAGSLAGTGCDYAEHSESARSDESRRSRALAPAAGI